MSAASQVKLFGLGRTEKSVSLLDASYASQCCDEVAADVSSRRLRSVPWLQQVSDAKSAPPYARIEWSKEEASLGCGRYREELVHVARVRLELEDLLYGDLSSEFRSAAIESPNGSVRPFSEALCAEVENRFGHYAVAEVIVGGRCCYRRLPSDCQSASRSWWSWVLGPRSFSSGPDPTWSSRLPATRDRASRVSISEARPRFVEHGNCFEDGLEAWIARTRRAPVVITVVREVPVLCLWRQACASLLRLLTIRRARERWADRLKTIVDSAVESAKIIGRDTSPWVIDRRLVNFDAGLQEDALASVFLCRDQRHLDDQLARFAAGNDDTLDPARAILEANIRKLDARIARTAQRQQDHVVHISPTDCDEDDEF